MSYDLRDTNLTEEFLTAMMEGYNKISKSFHPTEKEPSFKDLNAFIIFLKVVLIKLEERGSK